MIKSENLPNIPTPYTGGTIRASAVTKQRRPATTTTISAVEPTTISWS